LSARSLPLDVSSAAPRRESVAFERAEVEGTVSARFEAIAARHPERIAVRGPEASWTYARLLAAAHRIARALAAENPDPARPVALCASPGPLLFAAMLGTLEAGRFYVPLDPDLGDGWLRSVVGEADAVLALADGSGEAAWRRNAGRGPVLRLERLAAGDRTDPRDGGRPRTSPDDLAYVLFTSGSTGSPKGVLQSHRNLLHNAYKLSHGLGIAPGDRLSLLSSCSFGASVSDVYGALLNGACVCPFSLRGDGLLRLRAFVANEGISILHCVPSVFRRLASSLDGTEDFSKLRMVKLGGESVLSSDYELYRRRFPKTSIFHVGLGATEMSVIRQWFAGPETGCPSPVAPLGYEVDGTEVVLLDEDGAPAPGDTGEIAVVSRTLAVGYWRRPELTAQEFLPAPGRGDGRRMWRTGDLGKLLPDGCLLYLGRLDSRVKVRGHRVELAGVEAALSELPGVREAAVQARDGASPGQTRLVAYVVRDAPGRPDAGSLRRSLRERLAEPMIPSVFVFPEALPRTGNGKIDRGALPAPNTARPETGTPYRAPGDDVEERIAWLFAELLGIDRVGADDDFFDLGGDSLLVVEALLRLSDLFGREIALTEFIEAATPSALASRVRGAAAGAALPSGLIALRGGNGARPIFFAPGGTGDGEDLLDGARLARRLGPGRPVVGFRAGPPPYGSARELATECVRRMRALEPEGPYTLVGECIGGILVHAMALELVASGQEVALLVLLDTPFPDARRRFLHRLHPVREPWGDNLARRLRHHFRAVGRLESGRARYLLEKARVAARAIRSLRWRRRVARQRAEYVRTLLSHGLSRFPGRAHLILSDERRGQDMAARWAPFAASWTIGEVPGDHNTYIREHVDCVAEAMRSWLPRTD
jgi:amino acid adenylation domain-containing protein